MKVLASHSNEVKSQPSPRSFRTISSLLSNFLLVALFLLATSPLSAEVRTWTRDDGKTVEAELISVGGKSARLRLPTGAIFDIEVLRLSLQDQQFIALRKGLTPKNRQSPTMLPPALGVTFPLPDPADYSQRPSQACRLVIVKMPTANSELSHEGFAKIQADDFQDLVRLGEDMQGANVVALRADGAVVLWKENGEDMHARSADAAVAFNAAYRAELIWIDNEGLLKCETDDRDLEREFRRLGPVVRFRMLNGGPFVISRDGMRHLFSTNRSADLEAAGVGLQSLADFSPAAGESFWVVDRQGRNYHFATRRLEKKSDPGTFVSLPHSHLRQRADGTFEGFAMAYAFASVLKWDPGVPLPEIFVGGGAAAHRATDDGLWDILIQDEKWEIDVKLTDAFEDAVDLHLADGRYLYALFPAKTVSRSGFWDLEELIEARKELVK